MVGCHNLFSFRILGEMPTDVDILLILQGYAAGMIEPSQPIIILKKI